MRLLLSLAATIALAGPVCAGTTLVKGGLLITEKTQDEVPYVGYMAYGDDGKIMAIGAGDPPASLTADHVIDATGKIIAPGFISAHSHLYSGPLRGFGVNETLYGWIQAWNIYNQLASAEDIYWFSLNGSVDFLRNGITTAFDFTYSPVIGGVSVGAHDKVPEPTLKPGPYDEMQLKAKIDAGLRFIDSVGLPRVGTHDERIARYGRIYKYAYDTYGSNRLFLKMALSGGLQRAPNKDTAYLEVEGARSGCRSSSQNSIGIRKPGRWGLTSSSPISSRPTTTSSASPAPPAAR